MKYIKDSNALQKVSQKVISLQQYKYSNCRSLWMFYSRSKSNKINWLHERCLPILYGLRNVLLLIY